MRLQPSWIIECLQPQTVESIFFPLAPRPEPLLWFKRQGIGLYVNDPIESKALLLRSLVENSGEFFSEEHCRTFNQTLKASPDIQMNPFKKWEPAPFDRRQIDYLFYWREAAMEIANSVQRELFFLSVRTVMSYWLDMSRAEFPVPFAPDEVLGYIFTKQKQQAFSSDSKVFALSMPFDELGDEVESTLYVVPLYFYEKLFKEIGIDEYFHAWYRGDGNLEHAQKEISLALKGWVFHWENKPDFHKIIQKVGKASSAAICWSAAELPPKWHEENIVEPLKEVFLPRFSQAQCHFKATDRYRDDYDFLMVFKK